MPRIREPQSEEGTLVRAHRSRGGLTQKQLADLAGLSQARVSDTETGRKVTSDAVLAAIAAALNLSPQDADELRAAGRRSRERAPADNPNRARKEDTQIVAAVLKLLADGLQDAATRLKAA